MPFVKRDASGRIAALFRERSDEAPEYLAPNSPEIADFSDPDAARGVGIREVRDFRAVWREILRRLVAALAEQGGDAPARVALHKWHGPLSPLKLGPLCDWG